MEKYYTLFVATHELIKSPAIHMYQRLHDVTLFAGTEKTVTFRLPTRFRWLYTRSVELEFEPSVLDIVSVRTKRRVEGLTSFMIVSITIIPKEVGSTSLGIISEEVPHAYARQKQPLQPSTLLIN